MVSVITIFLNAEKFIQEAIDSVFAQTFDSWELLLVDDGSTDASTTLARRCAEQYPDKVRYLEHDGHQNRGMSASRNLGLRHARGKYVALLDSDDVWLPPKLERQVGVLESQPEAAMVYGSALWWYSWTGRPEDLQRDSYDFVENYIAQPNSLIKPPTLLTTFLRDGKAVPCPATVLVRREALEQIDGFEEAFHDLYEDQAFFAKLCLKESVYVEGECWAKYRQHKDSCCNLAGANGQESIARQFYLNWLEKYLAEKEVTDAEVLEALREALRPYREQENGHHTPADEVLQLASLLRVEPVSRCWGFDRGLPIDR
ncbi:MAG TPA: glycosyltransferase family A protein, partial [Blastocatellia bacterium]|nr:glycosyltransferase family A protein [Blastocatellia bacterium]